MNEVMRNRQLVRLAVCLVGMAAMVLQSCMEANGTDVFDGEPHMNPEFIGLNNVVCSPHTAAVSVEAVNTMSHAAVEHLMEYFGVTK